MTLATARSRSIRVTDGAGAAAADTAAIAAGIPSRALMQRAAAAAAGEIAHRFADDLANGVLVLTGPGNNGGDGWCVASALHACGIAVRVVECAAPRTTDSIAERAHAIASGVPVDDLGAAIPANADDAANALHSGGERIIVDALLGTGFRAGTPLRGALASAVAALKVMAARGARVVALDVPSGLDAGTGQSEGAAPCALTLTFGTIKRGQLVARELCGAIVALDIGLGPHAAAAGATRIADVAWFRDHLPPIPASAHKGTRRKVVIIGGAEGMAGAAMLAARGALRSGAGMVKCLVAPQSLGALQAGEPAVLAGSWPTSDAEAVEHIASWADAVLIGPGLGRAHARDLVERVLRVFGGPVVLDADALNAFAGDAAALQQLVGARSALLTPHLVEFGRLSGLPVADVLAHRFHAPSELARSTGAAVLLKGVPTIVSAVDATTIVVAEGTPMLATGGAGDVLGGIAVVLLAQTGDAMHAGAVAAFAHGRAAALVSARQVRGYTLDDVVHALPDVWGVARSIARPPVLFELPAVGEESAPREPRA